MLALSLATLREEATSMGLPEQDCVAHGGVAAAHGALAVAHGSFAVSNGDLAAVTVHAPGAHPVRVAELLLLSRWASTRPNMTEDCK